MDEYFLNDQNSHKLALFCTTSMAQHSRVISFNEKSVPTGFRLLAFVSVFLKFKRAFSFFHVPRKNVKLFSFAGCSLSQRE
jgi:hypothetical protein